MDSTKTGQSEDMKALSLKAIYSQKNQPFSKKKLKSAVFFVILKA